MGSQWLGMGIQLLKIPIFAKAIEKCDTVLRPFGVDIVNIITSLDPTMFDNILNSFVGISAIQVCEQFSKPINTWLKPKFINDLYFTIIKLFYT